MSCEYDNYGFTADEMSAGLASLVCNSQDEEEEYEEEEEEEIVNKDYKDIETIIKPIYTEKQETILKMIAPLNENIDIKNKIVKYIFMDNIDSAVNRYMKNEKLSLELVQIAKLSNGLEIILKNFLKNNCYFILNKKIILEIQQFIKIVYQSLDNEIVYLVVSKIQQFIHNKVQEKYDKDSHLDLNKNEMRTVLSISRLHLEIYNLKTKNLHSHISFNNKKEKFIKQEKLSKPILLKNQKYVPWWKMQHLESLIDLFPLENQKYLEKINQLNIIQPIEIYKDLILNEIK